MRVLKRQDGFTLLELILAMAVAAIVMLAIGTVLTSHAAMTKDAYSRAAVQTELQICADALIEMIKPLPEKTDFYHTAGTNDYLFESDTVTVVISFFETENRLEASYYSDSVLLRNRDYTNIHSFTVTENRAGNGTLSGVKILLTADSNGKLITLETDVGLRNNRGL